MRPSRRNRQGVLATAASGFLLILAAARASGQSAGEPRHRIIPIHPMTEDVEIL